MGEITFTGSLSRAVDVPQSRYVVLDHTCDFEKSIIDSEIFTRLLRVGKKWMRVNEREYSDENYFVGWGGDCV